MNSIKKIVLGTTVAAGATAMFVGTTAHADEVYTVKAGDSLSKISQKFAGDNTLIKAIAEQNSIDDINRIFVGEELTIPTDASSVKTTEVAPTTEKVETPVVTETPAQEYTYVAPVETVEVAPATTAVTTNSNSAKEWIAQKESGGSYTATNGRYIGRYQLDSAYLNGDYSPANQERVVEEYVAGRYGSWDAAKAFWLANGWY